MDVGVGAYAIAFVAGVLSTLSPCVLPLLPIIIGSSVQQHRLGPFAVAAGMSLSFAVIGTLLASVGVSLGLNQQAFRIVAAILMVLIGVVLLAKPLQERFAFATSGASGVGHTLLSKINIGGIRGQFFVGLLLGLIWSPCVGPTLGAAVTLASQGTQLGSVAFTMGIFGLGAGLPIALLGTLSRQAMIKMKSRLHVVGSLGKNVLGIFMVLTGIAIMTGQDKAAEAFLTTHSPAWLTHLTTYL